MTSKLIFIPSSHVSCVSWYFFQTVKEYRGKDGAADSRESDRRNDNASIWLPRRLYRRDWSRGVDVNGTLETLYSGYSKLLLYRVLARAKSGKIWATFTGSWSPRISRSSCDNRHLWIEDKEMSDVALKRVRGNAWIPAMTMEAIADYRLYFWHMLLIWRATAMKLSCSTRQEL